ncbi:MAG TPA: hypothetical protein VN174_00790 [Candidatus Methanoperedens sp.]|nr:hypothetical protein [Candidatus Methanoperedens sp.]
MIKGLNLPDKLFGRDTRLIVLWLEPIALGLVIFMSMVLVIVPKINEVPQKMAQIKQMKAKTADVEEKTKYLQSINQEDIKNNSFKLSMGLLPEKSNYLLVGVVRGAAADLGYAIDDFSLTMVTSKSQTPKKGAMNFEKLPVLVSLVGPTEKYIDLVKAIERSLPIMSIDKIDMRTLEGGISVVKLNVMAYYLPELNVTNPENLSLADLTPTKEEQELLSLINEYKVMTVETTDKEAKYTKYERQDPFFIP